MIEHTIMEEAHLFIYVHVFHLITLHRLWWQQNPEDLKTYFIVVHINPLTTYVTWSSKKSSWTFTKWFVKQTKSTPYQKKVRGIILTFTVCIWNIFYILYTD